MHNNMLAQVLSSFGVHNLPDEWEITRIGEIAELQNGYAFRSSDFVDLGIPIVRMSNLKDGFLDLTDAEQIPEAVAKDKRQYELGEGNLLVGMSGSIDNFATVKSDDLPCYLNQRVGRFKGTAPDQCDYDYLKLVVLSPIYRRAIEIMAAGAAQVNISKSQIESVQFPLPPPPEQRRIAEVLDTVDAAIQQTDEVIAKLKQVKAGLLQDLLTRGLDANGRLRDPDRHPEQFKDSPLGRIPKGWSIAKLRDTCSHVVDCPHSTPEYADEGILIARTSEIRNGRFNKDAARRVTEENYIRRISRLEPRSGDVIFTREAPVGEAFKIPNGMRVCLGQRTMVLRPREGLLHPDFLVAFVYSPVTQRRFSQLVGGTTNPHLNVGTVRDFPVTVPTWLEQQQIVDSLGTHEDRLLTEKAYRSKLQRLKQGLMQDLLTGRVRVPEAGEMVEEIL